MGYLSAHEEKLVEPSQDHYNKLQSDEHPNTLRRIFDWVDRWIFWNLTPATVAPGLITAKSVPQWSWNMLQSRAWLVEFIVKNGGDRGEAVDIADQFFGSGIGLYCTSEKEWQETIGYKWGRLVYKRLSKVRWMPGAVPKAMMHPNIRRHLEKYWA
jgi:hypothetical protein